MVPVTLMEPDSTGTKRHFARTLLRPKSVLPSPSVDGTKEQLRDIRDFSVSNMDSLVDILTSTLTAQPDVGFSFAKDAGQAVEMITSVAGGTPIGISKSAVVAKELVPEIVASGMEVVETYHGQVKPFENRFVKPWQLPATGHDTVPYAFDLSRNLRAIRSSSVLRRGSRNFTAVLGVNAMSAEDGTVLLFQHMHNISQAFTEARKLVFVVSIDKIVENLDAAILQTRSMATFGWGALPLSLHHWDDYEDIIQSLPFENAEERGAERTHIILLDNGRSELRQTRYRDLLACIGCRACTKGCPAFPFPGEGAPWSPREYIYFHVIGKRDSLDQCLQCKRCKDNCPLSIDLPGMILDARIEMMARARGRLSDNVLANFETLAKLGSALPPVANLVGDNRMLRWLGEKTLGISRERRLPRFRREKRSGSATKESVGRK